MDTERWVDLGPAEELQGKPLRQIVIERTAIALSFKDGRFSAVSGVCNHIGGPLGEGRLEGDYIVCPWHGWKFHCRTGEGEPGFEDDCIPRYATRIENDHVYVNLDPETRRNKKPHPVHPLARKVERQPGPVRIVGISTTAMDSANPRYSGSDDLLQCALDHARSAQATETRLIRLNDLKFRHCEGYYSKNARACTWPCSITQMDPSDQLDQVYEAMVHWADVVLLATPIRWGSASSLYYKMVERMNCIQNQITTHNKVLIRDKVAAFIIVGGQDNIQAVAGQMLGFFGEIGFLFPQFPYIAHSRGWTAEDMENNVEFIKTSKELREGAGSLVDRSIDLAARLIEKTAMPEALPRGGRKAHAMDGEDRGAK
ncbi:MAG: NAD(P)H-dependent oxidoreductase [Acidobacteriales bacterium]|nr:NAD(P)H-dependent oxidoreductase [Terriglobales bacterium]